MSKIGIIGHGIVGKALHYGFDIEGNDIRFYDKFKDSDIIRGVSKKSSTLEEAVNQSDFVFICLPTPYKIDKIDLSIIDENLNQITRHTDDSKKIIVIKSSVVPGTTANYSRAYPKSKFCFNPEFLREANYLEDFVNADRHIIGADNDSIMLKVTDLYRDRFPTVPIYQTDTKTAEMVKYTANSFLATKVIFANEIYDLCQALGINYDQMKGMVVQDKRIPDSHLDITSARGFGGKCFPKDIVALLGLFEENGLDASLLKAVWEKNLKIRKIKDWEDIPWVKSS